MRDNGTFWIEGHAGLLIHSLCSVWLCSPRKQKSLFIGRLLPEEKENQFFSELKESVESELSSIDSQVKRLSQACTECADSTNFGPTNESTKGLTVNVILKWHDRRGWCMGVCRGGENATCIFFASFCIFGFGQKLHFFAFFCILMQLRQRRR